MNDFVEQNTKESIAEKINMYRSDIEALVKYLPWLESKNKQDMTSTYLPQEDAERPFYVPIYDSTLLGFIKTAQKTRFINRNYVYVYSRKRIRSVKDELRLIERAQILDIEDLGAILSNYVIKGMTKSVMWNEGVRNGVFYALVLKMKELLEFCTSPMQR